jgi:F0F1-type ATP synthase delta subunit
VVDTDIIGGFVLKIEDNLIDASVRTKLRKIEKELKSRSLTA